MSITLGQAVWSSVKPIIKIYLIIGVGFLLAKMAILTVEATRAISDIVLTVLLPCLAFNKIVDSIEGKDIKTVGIICLTAVMIFGTGLGAAYLVRRTMPVPREWYGGILAGGMFPNISDLPIAYIQTMDSGFIFTPEEGEKGIACAIIFLTMFLFCVFNLGGFRLIEMDFHYSDEENQVPYEETSLQSVGKEIVSSDESTENNSRESETIATDNDSAQDNSINSDVSSEEQDIYSLDTALTELAPVHTRTTTMSYVSTLASLASSESSFIQQPMAYESLPHSNHDNGSFQAPSITSSITSSTTSSTLRNRNRSNSLSTIRSADQKSLPLQNLTDIIHEYSNVDQFGHERRPSFTPSLPGDTTNPPYQYDQSSATSHHLTMQMIRSSHLTQIITSDATVTKKDIDESGMCLPGFIQKLPFARLIVFFIKNCLRPCSIAVIVSLLIAFVPWLKALFVTTDTTPHIALAPDQEPALSFIMDFTGYVGAASVPFGLMLLGATLGRLSIGNLYPGFWKSATVLVILKLCIMPIFGVMWCDRLVKAGWCNWEDDKMLLFVIAMTWSLPTMTTLIYFTASYTPEDTTEPIQMECVSFFLMIQYPILVITLPFLVSYFLKVQIKL